MLVRTWKEASSDTIGLIAAGVAFYVFLALVPLLAAIVLTYGLLADAGTVARNMQTLTQVLPADVATLIGDQLMAIVGTSSGKTGMGLIAALAVALFGARNAAGGIISALNIAYEEEETRGFFAVNLLALGMTAAAVIGFVVALFAVAALSFLESLLPQAGPLLVGVLKLVPYLLLGLVAALAAAVLYRYGPSRDVARWRWLTPGGALFAVAWVALTFGFGIYVANFGNYGATYGSLSAVVVLLTWLYMTAYALLFGAELNSELEHQTARDTTIGPEAPMGARGAWAADHVASGADDAGEARDRAEATPELGRTAPPSGPATDVPRDARAERRLRLKERLGRL